MLKFNIRRIRQEKHLSQGKLSNLTGLSQSYISQLENGTKEPTMQVVNQIAQILNVCPLELIECNCGKCEGR